MEAKDEADVQGTSIAHYQLAGMELEKSKSKGISDGGRMWIPTWAQRAWLNGALSAGRDGVRKTENEKDPRWWARMQMPTRVQRAWLTGNRNQQQR